MLLKSLSLSLLIPNLAGKLSLLETQREVSVECNTWRTTWPFSLLPLTSCKTLMYRSVLTQGFTDLFKKTEMHFVKVQFTCKCISPLKRLMTSVKISPANQVIDTAQLTAANGYKLICLYLSNLERDLFLWVWFFKSAQSKLLNIPLDNVICSLTL